MNKELFFELFRKSLKKIQIKNKKLIRRRNYEKLTDLIIKDLGKSLSNEGFPELQNTLFEKQRASFKLKQTMSKIKTLEHFEKVFEKLLKTEWDLLIIKKIIITFIDRYSSTIQSLRNEGERPNLISFIQYELNNRHEQSESVEYIKKFIPEILDEIYNE